MDIRFFIPMIQKFAKLSPNWRQQFDFTDEDVVSEWHNTVGRFPQPVVAAALKRLIHEDHGWPSMPTAIKVVRECESSHAEALRKAPLALPGGIGKRQLPAGTQTICMLLPYPEEQPYLTEAARDAGIKAALQKISKAQFHVWDLATSDGAWDGNPLDVSKSRNYTAVIHFWGDSKSDWGLVHGRTAKNESGKDGEYLASVGTALQIQEEEIA